MSWKLKYDLRSRNIPLLCLGLRLWVIHLSTSLFNLFMSLKKGYLYVAGLQSVKQWCEGPLTEVQAGCHLWNPVVLAGVGGTHLHPLANRPSPPIFAPHFSSYWNWFSQTQMFFKNGRRRRIASLAMNQGLLCCNNFCWGIIVLKIHRFWHRLENSAAPLCMSCHHSTSGLCCSTSQ